MTASAGLRTAGRGPGSTSSGVDEASNHSALACAVGRADTLDADTLSSAVAIRGLRDQLAAVVIDVEDVASLEAFELAQDGVAHRASETDDDGTRVSLVELRAEIDADEGAADGDAEDGDRPSDAQRTGETRW